MNRNQREGRYQGAVTRFGNKWGDYRPNREGNRNGKRHIRSTVIPEEPMCNAFKDAKPVTAGAALNVLSLRYKKQRKKGRPLAELIADPAFKEIINRPMAVF